MTSRELRPQLAVSAAAAATGWAATWSWAGLVAEPFRYIGPGLVAAALIAVVGAGVRTLRGPWYAALAVQLVVVLAWFHHRQHVGGALGGWLPDRSSLAHLATQVHAGAGQVDKYAAPVATTHAQAPVYLLAVSLLLVLGVDLIAAGLRRAPWAGLPLIIALTVPISVLDSGLNPTVFVVTGLLFMVLLAVVEVERLTAWGSAITGHRPHPEDDASLGGAAFAGPVLRIAGATALAALVLPVLVPLGTGVLDRHRENSSGRGDAGTITLTNPILDLGRDLVRNDHVPLLEARTDALDPTYVRLTVLDRFTGDTWAPSTRRLAASDRAEGDLPLPQGVTAGIAGQSSTWSMSTTTNFATSWLPTPYITRRITTSNGDWRYTPGLLDISSAGAVPPAGVSYTARALIPSFDRDALQTAGRAGPGVAGPMTQVPGLLPALQRIAEQVTASGRTDYAKAVLLQDWFRRDGGFSYSLRRAPGNGMSELLRFITVDKVGYCEQFAAAMAVMARSLGIPARVVVGFLQPHQLSGDRFLYTSDDLHAWPEIYFAGSGWVRFEPTPAVRTGVAPSWTVGALPTLPSASTTTAPTARPSARPSKEPTPVTVTSSGTEHAPRWPLGAALAGICALCLLGPGLVRRTQRARRLRGHHDDPVRSSAGLWEELRATAVDLGLGWPEQRSVRTVAEALVRWAEPDAADAGRLRELVELVERARYSRCPVMTEDEHARGVQTVLTWSVLLRRAVPVARVRRAHVLPRSVWQRTQLDVARDAAATG